MQAAVEGRLIKMPILNPGVYPQKGAIFSNNNSIVHSHLMPMDNPNQEVIILF